MLTQVISTDKIPIQFLSFLTRQKTICALYVTIMKTCSVTSLSDQARFCQSIEKGWCKPGQLPVLDILKELKFSTDGQVNGTDVWDKEHLLIVLVQLRYVIPQQCCSACHFTSQKVCL